MSKRPEVLNAAGTAALSGGGYGGILGALAGIITKKPEMGMVIRKALMGAGIGGAVAGGSTLAGTALMGRPKNDEPNPYMRRGAVGGAALGAAGGAGLGAAVASGRVKMPGMIAKSEDWISEYLKTLAKNPSRANMLRAAGLGALGLGGLGAYNAGYEGMQLDALGNEIDE